VSAAGAARAIHHPAWW